MTWQLRNRGRRLGPTAGGTPLLELAKGHVFSHCPPAFREIRRQGIRTIFAEDPISGKRAIIYPRFEQHFSRGDERFLLFAAATDAEISEAIALISKLHKKGPPRTGMILAIRALDRVGSPVVATAVGAEVYYTMLRERDAFARVSLGNDWYERFEARELSRADVVRNAAIVCATRFVVDEGMRSLGLSEFLANGLAMAAAAYRWPPANYVEVVRWMKASNYAGLCLRLKNDFLTCSGYVPEPLHEWRSAELGIEDFLKSLSTSHKRVRGYYWRNVVPLQLG